MTNETTVQEPKKRGKHAAPVSTKVDYSEDIPENLLKRASVSAIILPFAVLVMGVIRSIGNTFERLCPEPLNGRCAEVPVAGQIPVLSDLALTFGIVLTLLTLVLIVEMLTWRYKTKIAYTGLVLLAVFITFPGSGVCDIILQNIVQDRL